MKKELYDKLKARADKEGIDLSILMRKFLWEGIRQEENRELGLDKLQRNS